MGYWKNRQIEEDEQGWHYIDDRSVCSDCLTDEALKAVVQAHLTEPSCSYCGRRVHSPIAADLNEVLAAVGRGLFAEWSLAERELFRDEGEYVGQTWDTYELFDHIGWPTEDEKLQDDLVLAFSDNLWCELNPFQLTPDEALAAGWNEFKELVTTKSRYLFLMAPDDSDLRGYQEIAPADMLRALGRALETADVTRVLPRGSHLWRARVHQADEKLRSAKSLGSPVVARYSNRMSPAGISFFYGALERETAIAEVADRLDSDTPWATVARFLASDDLRLLDLAGLPEVPSLFDEDHRHRRAALMFLRGFADDIARPVQPERLEHVEYVPTQIVTEFVRLHLAAQQRQYDGVIYRSARNPNGRNVALFFDHTHCYDVAPESGSRGVILDAETIDIFS